MTQIRQIEDLQEATRVARDQMMRNRDRVLEQIEEIKLEEEKESNV